MKEQARCVVCGEPAVFFCDAKILSGVTCDSPLCSRCRLNAGVKDYCPRHVLAAVSGHSGSFKETIVIDDDGEL